MNEGLRVFKFAPGASENFKNLVAWMMRNRTEDRPQNVAQIYESLKTGKVPVANFAPVAPFAPTRNEDTILRNANTTSGREPKSRLATRRGTVMSQNENKGNNKKWLLIAIVISLCIVVIAGMGLHRHDSATTKYATEYMSSDSLSAVETISDENIQHNKKTTNNIENKNDGNTGGGNASQDSRNVIHKAQRIQGQATNNIRSKGSNSGGQKSDNNKFVKGMGEAQKANNDDAHKAYDGIKKPNTNAQQEKTKAAIVNRQNSRDN